MDQPIAADATPYSATLDGLVSASGAAQTYLNGVNKSPAQADFLAFLQGSLASAIAAARADPNPS